MIIHPQSWGGGGGGGEGEGSVHVLLFSLSRGAKVSLKCRQLS